MLPIGGSTPQLKSVCERWPATRLEAWMVRISGCPSGAGAVGWMSSSPKRRPVGLRALALDKDPTAIPTETDKAKIACFAILWIFLGVTTLLMARAVPTFC
jgi:hypothetical protein